MSVEVVIGFFRHPLNDSKRPGELIEEVSLLCHFNTNEQKDFLLGLALYLKQYSYIEIDKDGQANHIPLEGDVIEDLGQWQEIPPMLGEDLKPGEGFTIFDGKYYMAKMASASKVRKAA